MLDPNLLEPHRKGMRRLALKILKREELADEVVQEAFFAIMNSSKPFKGDSALKTYIHRAVYSKSIDVLRREARETVNTILVEGILGSRFDPSFRGRSPEDLLLLSEKVWFLQDALRSLGNVQRKVLRMVLEEGLKPKEISGILGTTPNAIRLSYFKARKKLREKLKEVA